MIIVSSQEEIFEMSENVTNVATVVVIRPTLKIAGGFIEVCQISPDLTESESRKLDVSGSPDYEWPGLFELIAAELAQGHRRFVLDLQKVPWMNSRGLGRLIEFWQLVGKEGARVEMVCGPGRILTILEISQVSLIMKPKMDLAAGVLAINAES